MYLVHAWWPWRPEENIRPPRTGTMDGVEQPCGHWESNLGPLQGQLLLWFWPMSHPSSPHFWIHCIKHLLTENDRWSFQLRARLPCLSGGHPDWFLSPTNQHCVLASLSTVSPTLGTLSLCHLTFIISPPRAVFFFLSGVLLQNSTPNWSLVTWKQRIPQGQETTPLFSSAFVSVAFLVALTTHMTWAI